MMKKFVWPWMSRKLAIKLITSHREALEHRVRREVARAERVAKVAKEEHFQMSLSLQNKDRTLREIKAALAIILSKDNQEVPASPPALNIDDAIGKLRSDLGLGKDLTV